MKILRREKERALKVYYTTLKSVSPQDRNRTFFRGKNRCFFLFFFIFNFFSRVSHRPVPRARARGGAALTDQQERGPNEKNAHFKITLSHCKSTKNAQTKKRTFQKKHLGTCPEKKAKMAR